MGSPFLRPIFFVRPTPWAALLALGLGACGTGGVSFPSAGTQGAPGVSAPSPSVAPQAAPAALAGPTDSNAAVPQTPMPAASGGNTVVPKALSMAAGIEVLPGSDAALQFPATQTNFWLGAMDTVAALGPTTQTSARLVVATYTNGSVRLGFMDQGLGGLGSSKVSFAQSDTFEALLTALDGKGAKVILEVQPGAVALPALAQVVLSQYGKHPSVVGFGVDLQYYGSTSKKIGSTVLSDSDATALVRAVQSANSNVVVYLRHYTSMYMPPTARTGLGFVFDAQGFKNLTDMAADDKAWAAKFAPNPVQFVIGADGDLGWACALAAGPKPLLAAAQSAGTNVDLVTWSQSTITQLYPTSTFSCVAGPAAGPVTTTAASVAGTTASETSSVGGTTPAATSPSPAGQPL